MEKITKQLVWNVLFEKAVSYDEKEQYISNYRNEFPEDVDVYAMEIELLVQKNKLEDAYNIAKVALRRNPYLIIVHFNLAKVCEMQSKYLEAYRHYSITKFLAGYAEEKDIVPICEKSMQTVLKHLEESIKLLPEKERKLLIQETIPNMLGCEVNQFGYKERRFCTFQNIIGDYYFEYEKKYIGVYQVPNYIINALNNKTAIELKTEIRTVLEDTHLQLPKEPEEWIVPIAVEKVNTLHLIHHEQHEDVKCLQRQAKNFYYYRVCGGSSIVSSDKCYYGEPIPIRKDKEKKKLILSIFVDGLAQVLLNNGRFVELMPNTARYFEKGLICTQAYSSGEWTYPSIAGAMSGLSTVQHMMFHNEIDWKLPDDVKTLMEYFHQEGYHTSIFSGDRRIIPSYGYIRGCDRFIYQLQHVGFSVEKMIGNVIDEIDALKEVNQFVWMTIGDLHDVVDELILPTSVATSLNVKDRDVKQNGTTSVKQLYDSSKQHQYEKMMTYIDRYLGMLFQLLEDTYEDDEIIISLFSDHGQGYLIPDGGQFLGPERSNIAYMFRDGQHIGQTNEIMSLLDYTAIMCKLAGINYNENNVSGRLPKIFGGQGRKWTLTESLHPNDYYRAALVNENYRFYFCNPNEVRYDGRFKLVEYVTYLTDKDGKSVNAPDVQKECTNIVLEHIAYLCLN